MTERESKNDCEFHEWDEHGRPNPPAGYCGPDCRMRPAETKPQVRGYAHSAGRIAS